MKPRPVTRSQWAAIRLLAMDVDGVLTDGTVGIGPGGEVKFFSVLDGMGLARVLKAELAVAWISGRPSQATSIRARELKIPHVIQGRVDKKEALSELVARLGLAADQCAYIGDDEIDEPALRWAGIGVAVPGATAGPLRAARYVTSRPGGRGAVREVCDRILAARGAARP